MASPITLRSHQKYEVFLSCRTEDTRKNFADHLYTALKEKGFAAFIEDEAVERGNEISFDSLKAIKESKVSIVILSRNYATSTKCLDELVKIVEIMSGNEEHTVLPVFYDVDPSDVRKQRGDYGKVFDKPEENDQEKVEKWRAALVRVANLSGWDLQNSKIQFLSSLVSERDEPDRMAESKKNHGQRIDALEGAVGTMQNELSEIKEDIHNIFQRLDQLVRLHDDAAHNASSSAGSKGKGVMVSPRVEVTPEFQGTNSFTGLRHDFRLRKLDMPAFNGENPDGWILRAERYFTINQFTNAEKIEAAVISFEGEALSWFQWENRRRTIDRWDEMKHLLLKQFRTAQNGTLYEQWLNLEQGGGSVREYNKSFIDLSAPLENISEEIALGNFISGLRTDIRAELRLLEPINLGRAMDLAQKIEEKMQAQNSVMTQKSSFENSGNSAWLNNANTRTASTGTDETRQHPGIGATAKPAGEVRRLSESELQRRRVNGLCFRCDERWGPGHRCRQRELSALLIEEDEGGGTEKLEEQKEAEPARI